MTPAERNLKNGQEYPYDGSRPAVDWAHRAARGIIADFEDRRGIQNGFYDIDEELKIEIVDVMSETIRAAYATCED